MIKKLIGNVWSADGYGLGPVNSKVGKGESIIDYQNGDATLVTKGTVGKDTEYSSVQDGDQNVIAGNDIDWSNGQSFAQQVLPLTMRIQKLDEIAKKRENFERNGHLSSLSKNTARVEQQEADKVRNNTLAEMKEITDRQKYQHDVETAAQQSDFMEYGQAARGKDNKDKKRDYSWMSAQFPALSNLATGIGRLLYWNGQKPVYNNTYIPNTYMSRGLQGLASLRYNPYPAVQAAQQAEREAAYANANSGGLSGAQKYLGRIALGLGNMQNMANVYAQAEQQNNALRGQYYNAALQYGDADATRRQTALQHDLQRYDQAHGAKIKGVEQWLANSQNAINQWYANEFKRKTYQDTLDIYKDQTEFDRQALQQSMAEAEANRKATADMYDKQLKAWQNMNNANKPQSTFSYTLSYPNLFGNSTLYNNMWYTPRQMRPLSEILNDVK